MVLQSLISQGHLLVQDELLLSFDVLVIGLFFEIICEFHSSLPLLFSLLLLSNGELLVSQLPELGELSLLLLFGSHLSVLSGELVLTGLLDGLLHLKSSSLFLLEQLACLILSLGDLLVEDLLFLVSKLHELGNLFIHKLLLDLLLCLEPLGLLGLLQVLESLLLGSILLDSLLLLLLLDGDLLLDLQELLVGLLELVPGLSCSLLPLEVPELLPLELLLDLLLDELALKLLLLHLLDIVELEVLELVLDVLSILHFLMVLFLQLLSEPLIVLLHLLLFKLLPLKVDLLLELLLSLLGLHLSLLLLDDVAHEHLAVEGLHHISVVMEHLVCFLKLCLSQALLIGLLFGIDLPSFNLEFITDKN